MEPSLPPDGQPSRSRYASGDLPVFACWGGGEWVQGTWLNKLFSLFLLSSLFYLSTAFLGLMNSTIPAEAVLQNHTTCTLPGPGITDLPLVPDTTVKIFLTPPHPAPAGRRRNRVGGVGPGFLVPL